MRRCFPVRIAIFDYKVLPTNPVGSLHLQLVRSLCREYDITVFAVEFANPCPDRVRFVRVPVPKRPLALLFLSYHLMAPLIYLIYRWRTRQGFDLVQMVESNLSFGAVAYVHFCHRAYLRHHWKAVGARGFRGWMRYLDHLLHAWMEPWVFRQAKWLVVPSQGLKRELEETYPFVRGKIQVIPNPVDLERFVPPENFDREGFRKTRGVSPEDIVLVFAALGHFERKGLPPLLEALKRLDEPKVKLWVVGGEPDLVAFWESRTQAMGLAGQVSYWGMQRDVRPFLCSSFPIRGVSLGQPRGCCGWFAPHCYPPSWCRGVYATWKNGLRS